MCRIITYDEFGRYDRIQSHSNKLVVVSFIFNYFTGLTVSSSIKIKLDAMLFPGTIVTVDTNGW